MRVQTVSILSTLGWPAWSATLLSTGLLAITITYWSTQLWAPKPLTAPAVATSDLDTPPSVASASRLFGNAESGAAASRGAADVDVVGVLSAGPRGSAILSVDGNPPKAYAVGDRIDGARTVIAVEPGRVVVGSATLRAELPAPARPDPSVLTSGPRAAPAAPRD